MRFLIALFLLSPLALATLPATGTTSTTGTAGTTGTAPSKTPPVVVHPNERKTVDGRTVTNGNYNEQFPQYAGSTGDVRIKQLPGASGKEIKCESSVRGLIEALAGDHVIISTNSNPCDVRGTGLEVDVGSGSTSTVTNTGTQDIHVHLPGGSTVDVHPGEHPTFHG